MEGGRWKVDGGGGPGGGGGGGGGACTAQHINLWRISLHAHGLLILRGNKSGGCP